MQIKYDQIAVTVDGRCGMCIGGREQMTAPKVTDPFAECVAVLRRVEGEFHFALPLRLLGAVLLVLGSCWAFTRFVVANSFLLVIFAGAACLVLSVLADPRGLVRFLPEEQRDFLFNGRIFDILHDDTPVVNAIRKWGPVQLLLAQDGKQAEPIQHLVQNMEPEVLRLVLCRSFFSFLPGPLRLLMLPSEQLSSETLEAKGDAKETTVTKVTENVEEVPSVEWIQNFLQVRNQKKQEKIKYPELMPLVASTLGLQLAPFMAYGRSFFRWVQFVALTSGIGSLLSAGLFFHDTGRYALQRAASGLLQRSVVPDARWSKVAAAVSLFSAGGAIVVSIVCERCKRRWAESDREGR